MHKKALISQSFIYFLGEFSKYYSETLLFTTNLKPSP
ncbi:hypothetical protein SAMN05443663_102311 [Flavobacterium defluvii]|uniref:Uncharacterized protein n=1 Tax=Flavobacterium defluvii TaxID=370979 RepID=A0A1M5I8L7_9FLAO|nr:hypothetical protein SAMN05443663_102311 [Flavobacterium defluvii]